MNIVIPGVGYTIRFILAVPYQHVVKEVHLIITHIQYYYSKLVVYRAMCTCIHVCTCGGTCYVHVGILWIFVCSRLATTKVCID